MSIDSAVFAGLTIVTDRQTDHASSCVTIDRNYVQRSRAMRPNNCVGECSATWECPAGFERCSGSRQCVRDYLFCNGVNDCALGSDEDDAFCGETIDELHFKSAQRYRYLVVEGGGWWGVLDSRGPDLSASTCGTCGNRADSVTLSGC